VPRFDLVRFYYPLCCLVLTYTYAHAFCPCLSLLHHFSFCYCGYVPWTFLDDRRRSTTRLIPRNFEIPQTCEYEALPAGSIPYTFGVCAVVGCCERQYGVSNEPQLDWNECSLASNRGYVGVADAKLQGPGYAKQGCPYHLVWTGSVYAARSGSENLGEGYHTTERWVR
jgi:hypothetical protein